MRALVARLLACSCWIVCQVHGRQLLVTVPASSILHPTNPFAIGSGTVACSCLASAQVSMTQASSVPGHVTMCALNRRTRGSGHRCALRVWGLWVFCWPGDSARGALHIQECGESCSRALSVTCRVRPALGFISITQPIWKGALLLPRCRIYVSTFLASAGMRLQTYIMCCSMHQAL